MEKQQACLIVFPECRKTYQKLQQMRQKQKEKLQFFIFASAECSKTYQKLYAILVNAKSHPEPFHPGIHRVATLN